MLIVQARVDNISEILLLQRPNGTFVDVAPTNVPPPPNNGGQHLAAVADIGCDADVDIYVGDLGRPQFHINDGSRVYAEEARARLPEDLMIFPALGVKRSYLSQDFLPVASARGFWNALRSKAERRTAEETELSA